MATHLNAIGLIPATADEFTELAYEAKERGEEVRRPDDGSTYVWRDDSGATLVVHLTRDGLIECLTPSFASTSALVIRPTALAVDAKCRFCSVLTADLLDEGGEVLYPVPLQLEDVWHFFEDEPNGKPAAASLAAFAEEIEVWPDEHAYRATRTEDAPLEPQTLLAVGLSDAPPQARVVMSGVVERVEDRRNGLTDLPFRWAKVATYGGVYDAVFAVDDRAPELAPGSVVQGFFWLVGRLLPISAEIPTDEGVEVEAAAPARDP